MPIRTRAARDDQSGGTLGELIPDHWAQVVANSLAGKPQVRLAWPSQGLTEDLTEAVVRIDVPVLVLAGSDDRVDPRAVLTGCLSPLEIPDAVAAAVSGFIDARARREPAPPTSREHRCRARA